MYYLQSRYYDPTLGRFINADAFAATGQGFVGNNMFAYCNNDPVNYLDFSGGLPVRTKYISDCIGGVPHVGTISSSDWHEMEDFLKISSSSFDFAVVEASVEVEGGIKTAKILGGSIDMFGVGLDGVTLGAVDISAVSLDLKKEKVTWSLFDLGNASASAGFNATGISLGAMASVWSPSVSYSLEWADLTVAVHVGAWGAEIEKRADKLKIGYANVIGFSISIS